MSDSPNAIHFGWTQPETVWRQLLRPWFAACARVGWSGAAGDAPAVPMLLMPEAGMIAWVKGRLVAEGLGCLGVHFHTPGTLRSLLAEAYGVQGRTALREDLHLLMGQAARSLPDNPVAQAAVLDPVALCRLCDRIDRAGWRAEGFSTSAGRQLAVRYFELLAAQGLRTVADVERELLEQAQQRPLPVCGQLLVAGFGCEHSDSLLLLRAAALCAPSPILCLDTTPAVAAATAVALAWQASCEEYFGLSQPLADAEDDDSSADSGQDDGGAADNPDTARQAPADHLQAFANEEDSLFQWASSAEYSPEPAADAGAGVSGRADGSRHALGETGGRVHSGTEGGDPSAALGGWAQALAAHRSVDAGLHQPLQRALRLLTFRTLDEEARHTVSLVRHWLTQISDAAAEGGFGRGAEPVAEQGSAAAPRIGIILAGDGSLLGREIAAGLSAFGIAHYDSLGHQPARTAAQSLLEIWCNWQNSNQIDDLNAFVAELARQNYLSPADPRHWERAVDKALSQTLCAELTVVAASLGRPQPDAALAGGTPALKQSDGEADSGWQASASQLSVWQLLESWPQLPEQASFEAYWAQTQPVLALLGWPLRQEPLLERAQAFAQTLGGRLPRSAFISWLRSVTRVPGRTRNALGHEPFAKVHLVTLAEAGRQQWSHLCVVGMVHGQWPPLEADSALLDPERCAELNRRAERQSRFGQGQACIGGGHTFLLGARQLREAFDAAFVRLLEQGGARCIALSRYRFEPSAQHAEAFASEYFLRSLYAATGSLEIAESPPLAGEPQPPAGDQIPVASLISAGGHAAGGTPAESPACAQTALSNTLGSGSNALAEPSACAQVALAYSRRRDPGTGFDAYSYALAAPPPVPLRLSCSHWAEVLNRPAHAWYRYVLRVKKRRRASDSDFRQQSQGIWVHNWLNPTGGRPRGQALAFVSRLSAAQWRQQVGERAEVLRRSTAAVYARAGRQLPQWWQSDWSAALAIAEGFAETLGTESVEPFEAMGSGASDGLPQNGAAGGLPQGVAARHGAAGGDISGDSGRSTAERASALGGSDSTGGDDLTGGGDSLGSGQNGVPRDFNWGAVGGEWPLAPLRLDLPGHPLDGLVLEGIVDLLLANTFSASAILTDATGSSGRSFSPHNGAAAAAVAGGGGLGAVAPPPPVSGPSLWVVDYKTGGDASLSLRSWESRGAGLQLVLYAFALRARGAGSVQMTMLRKGSALEPQLDLDALSPEADIWQKLAVPMRDGVFGMRGLLRDPHSFNGDYPLATLGIDPVVLERKARITLIARASGG